MTIPYKVEGIWPFYLVNFVGLSALTYIYVKIYFRKREKLSDRVSRIHRENDKLRKILKKKLEEQKKQKKRLGELGLRNIEEYYTDRKDDL
jgi:hypothetical protein